MGVPLSKATSDAVTKPGQLPALLGRCRRDKEGGRGLQRHRNAHLSCLLQPFTELVTLRIALNPTEALCQPQVALVSQVQALWPEEN